MRMPYRITVAECREAMRQFLGLNGLEPKQGSLNKGARIFDGWIACILVWAAVIAMLLASVAALLGRAE
jgi:hypothetical protein